MATAASATPSDSPSSSQSSLARPSRGIKRRRPGDPTPLVEQAATKAATHSAAAHVKARSTEKLQPSPSADIVGSGPPHLVESEDVKQVAEDVDEESMKEHKLFQGWKDEYFEIVEQLPLELHRSFALLRELDVQVNGHLATIQREALNYRDWRVERHAKLRKEWQSAQPQPVDEQEGDPSSPPSKPRETPATDTDDELHTPPLPAVRVLAVSADGSEVRERGAETNERQGETMADGTTSLSEQDQDQTAHAAAMASLEAAARDQHSRASPIATTSDHTAASSASSYRRHASLSAIAEAIKGAMAASEEKVGLALSAYHLIDRQCRRLDADLAKMTGTASIAAAAAISGDLSAPALAAAQAAQGSPTAPTTAPNENAEAGAAKSTAEDNRPPSEGLRLGTMESTRSSRFGGSGARRKSTSLAADVATTASTSANKRGTKKDGDLGQRGLDVENADEASTAAEGPGPIDVSAIVADMAYDPSEPVYCYCQQPSFGFMVGCDNDECAREWYHLSCLESRGELTPVVMQSLEDERKKWYCKDCRAMMKAGAAGPGAAGSAAATNGKVGLKKKGRKSRR
ncbi:unnamed protein product [Parajaminaea phylloscopi]